ncbi:MAG: cellulase family glycosylhydrolase [Pyrinomonas methylaliphatogenes]|nr:cellulase family glycosylhydrolase [Pyrinomonas methylaliphatogenes]
MLPLTRRLAFIALFSSLLTNVYAQRQRWTEKQANEWYSRQPYLVGANYVPATAINQLEMWQADTFDPKRIDMELGWAEQIGMNTMRVFLHDLAYKQDPEGFKRRLDQFLSICARHGIRPILVIFDSVWDPFPAVGKQRDPRPGIHNSGWIQSPGAIALQDPTEYPRLERYVKDVIGAFARDERILAWDLWNEPDNTNDGSYGASEPKNKVELVVKLLPQVFQWARSANPSQPLTSGVWKGDYSSDDKLDPMQRIQLEQSDIITFHNYDNEVEFERRIKWLQRYNRPIICTEYMARSNGSTFQKILPIAKRYNVGAINWGLVMGKTQTHLPWDSWQHPYVGREPAVWFHEVFRTDGTPYSAEEVNLIRQITGKAQTAERRGR